MPYKRGAPRGNRNRLVHGHYATATISLRRACRRTIYEARARLAELRALDRLIGTLDGIAAMHAAGAPPEHLAAVARAFESALARLEGPKPATRPWPANNPYTDDLPS
jgi:hypothetical protein